MAYPHKTARNLFFIFMLIMLSQVEMINSDDIKFSTVHLQYTLPEYLVYCYWNRSGRFFAETLFYYLAGPYQFLWKWLCASSISACAFMFYKFVTNKHNMEIKEKLIFAYVSCFSIPLINSSILSPSVFWTTGALVYLIPFTLGLIGFTPFFNVISDDNYVPKKVTFLYIVPTILTMLGQEQISLCFTAFSFIVLSYLFIRKRHFPRILWSIFFISLFVQIFALTTPGANARFQMELIRWFPEFNNIDLISRFSLSLYFLFNTIINYWYLLLLILWIICAGLLRKNNLSTIANVLVVSLLFYSFLISLKYFKNPDPNITSNIIYYIERLFTFHFLTFQSSQNALYIVPYVFWSIGILEIPIALYLTFNKSKFTFFYILIFLASLASIILITFSPTLFVSGGRTSFVSNMLILFLILLLLRHYELRKYLALSMIVLGILGLFMLYLTWQSRGFQIYIGNLDITDIPFIVRGNSY